MSDADPVDATVTRRGAVVLVGNPAAPYSRGLRIARALAEMGYAVEIAAVAATGLPDHERDGEVVIRRYRPSGRLRMFAATHAGTAALTPVEGAVGHQSVDVRPDDARPGGIARLATARTSASAGSKTRRANRGISRIARRVRRPLLMVAHWILWPHTVRAWWHTLARELEPADLYHACGSLTVAPALARRSRDEAEGRRSVVIYDAIDNVFESNNVLDMPAVFRRLHAGREAGWARAADGLLTVNNAVASRLATRWGLPQPPAVIANYPEIGAATQHGDLIRRATGLPPTTRIILFQGRIGPHRGLDEAAEAALLVPDAALVLLGFGPWTDRCRTRDADPRFAGRHFTLPPVHPDELVAWTASADVTIVPLPPVSANQRQGTSNKFWESIAAGVPIVMSPGLEVMSAMVRQHDLGTIAASLDPVDLAAAVTLLLDEPPDVRAARRRRIAALGRDQFSWSAEAVRYKQFVERLTTRTDAS